MSAYRKLLGLSLQKLNVRNYCKHAGEISAVLYSILLLLTHVKLFIHSWTIWNLSPPTWNLKIQVIVTGFIISQMFCNYSTWSRKLSNKLLHDLSILPPERHRKRNIRTTLTLASWKTRLYYWDLLETSYKRDAWPNCLWRKWERCHKHQQISFRQEAEVKKLWQT